MGIYDTWISNNPGVSPARVVNLEFLLKSLDRFFGDVAPPDKPTGNGTLVSGCNLTGNQSFLGRLNRGWYRVVLKGAGGGAGADNGFGLGGAGAVGGFLEEYFYIP